MPAFAWFFRSRTMIEVALLWWRRSQVRHSAGVVNPVRGKSVTGLQWEHLGHLASHHHALAPPGRAAGLGQFDLDEGGVAGDRATEPLGILTDPQGLGCEPGVTHPEGEVRQREPGKSLRDTGVVAGPSVGPDQLLPLLAFEPELEAGPGHIPGDIVGT